MFDRLVYFVRGVLKRGTNHDIPVISNILIMFNIEENLWHFDDEQFSKFQMCYKYYTNFMSYHTCLLQIDSWYSASKVRLKLNTSLLYCWKNTATSINTGL